jgi:hypothetical protein
VVETGDLVRVDRVEIMIECGMVVLDDVAVPVRR